MQVTKTDGSFLLTLTFTTAEYNTVVLPMFTVGGLPVTLPAAAAVPTFDIFKDLYGILRKLQLLGQSSQNNVVDLSKTAYLLGLQAPATAWSTPTVPSGTE